MPNLSRLLRRHSVDVISVSVKSFIGVKNVTAEPGRRSKDDLISELQQGRNKSLLFVSQKHSELSPLSQNEITTDHVCSKDATDENIVKTTDSLQNSCNDIKSDNKVIEEQITELLPIVKEVNTVAKELNKQREFEVLLIPPECQDTLDEDETPQNKVMVQMTDQANGNKWLWTKEKFWVRRLAIQGLYQSIKDGEITPEDKLDFDPFWEEAGEELIGSAMVCPRSLAYGLDFEDELKVCDYKGNEVGKTKVKLIPCSRTGLDQGPGDFFVEDPKELIGKPYHIQVVIESAQVYNPQFTRGISIKYKLYADDTVKTEVKTGTLQPRFDHCHICSFDCITTEHISYFKTGSLAFQVYGIQDGANVQTMPTSDCNTGHNMPAASEVALKKVSFSGESSDLGEFKSELVVCQHKLRRLEQKEQALKVQSAQRDLCEAWEGRYDCNMNGEQFHDAVVTLAHSSGNKHKTCEDCVQKILEKNNKSTTMDKFKLHGGENKTQTKSSNVDKYRKDSVHSGMCAIL